MPPLDHRHPGDPLTGHALRNAHLRERALRRAETAPPLARILVTIRAHVLGLTRQELARRSGISRGTLRDLELGIHTPTRRILQMFLAFCQAPACPLSTWRSYAVCTPARATISNS